MLDVLKNLEPFEQKDLLFFLQNVIGGQRLHETDIRRICDHSSGHFQLNIVSILNYCIWAHLVDRADEEDAVSLHPDLMGHIDDTNTLHDLVIRRTLSQLFNFKVLESGMFSYDVINNRFIFRNEMLPLTFSSVRNLMVSQEVLIINRTEALTEFIINSKYEDMISVYCKSGKKLIGLEDLRRKLEENNKAGEEAELFALRYEKSRIANCLLTNKIRIISDIDVCAGYDIVSFEFDNSIDFDRFIEVKAISNSSSFFWSKNEINTALLKGRQYYLYLVDLRRTSEVDYSPIIICDPATTIFKADEWYAEPQTYHVFHI